MFIPFKIKKTTIDSTCKLGRYTYNTDKMLEHVKANINAESIKRALIDGTRLQEEWFPSEAYDSLFDVFISHAHADDYAVKQLAGFLQEEYGLRSFIDSVYWGYIGQLQKDLDDWYSAKESYGHKTYDYKTSNFMAANVHIMLSTALLKMMDSCECLIFVDSDNSLTYQKSQPQTPSPWIYEEMSFAKRLRVNIPLRHKDKFQVTINESRERSSVCFFCHSTIERREAKFTYDVDLRDFEELLISDFELAKGSKGKKVLDLWYDKYNATNRTVNKLLG